jgi:hypothetical protein
VPSIVAAASVGDLQLHDQDLLLFHAVDHPVIANTIAELTGQIPLQGFTLG